MSRHDPFCDIADRWDAGLSVGDVSGPCPGCNLIASVRTDERAVSDVADSGLLREAIHQRDAALAEAAKYRTEINRMVDEFSSIRMEHEALGMVHGIAKNVRDERDAARAEADHLKAILATLKRLNGADTAEINRLKETVALRDEVAVLQDALEDVVNQACSESGTDLDSMALSAYAHGMRVLAERGRITIEREVGRRVIGHWVEADHG